MKSIERRSLDSSIANAILFIINIGNSILIVPILLKFWGSEKYGVWIATFAFYSLIKTLDTGHQNYVGNEFNKLFYVDKEKAKKYLSSGIKFCVVIGTLELVLLFGLIQSGLLNSLVGITSEQSNDLGVPLGLSALVVGWLLSGNIGGLLVRIILPLGVMAKTIYLSILNKGMLLGVLIIAGYYQLDILKTGILYALSGIGYTFILFFYVKRLMPSFYPWWIGGDLKTGLRNFKRSIILTINNVLDQVSQNGLIIMISSLISVALVPLFTTIRTLCNTALQISSMILEPLYPDLIRFDSKSEAKKLIQVFETNWIFSGFIVQAGFISSIAFVIPFYHWWTQGELVFDKLLYILFVISILILNFSKGFILYLSSVNEIKPLFKISITRFFVVIIVSLIGIQIWGLKALATSLVLAELFSSGVMGFHYTSKRIKVKMDSKLDYKLIKLPLVPLLFTVASLFLWYLTDINVLILVTVCILILVIPYILMYTRLSNSVKNRLLSLLVR